MMKSKTNKVKNVDNNKENFSQKAEVWLNKYVVPGLKIVAANKYLRALMEGFYVTLPIVVFSSIVGIIMWVPPAIKGDMAWYPLIARQVLNRLYVLTMGLVSLWFAMGIAVSLAEKLNKQMPNGIKMNILMVAFAAGASIFMMSVTGTFALNNDGTQTENYASLLVANLGSQGMLTAIIVGLTMPWVFYLPVRYNWTIKLPKAVPQGVSQSFSDIIPFGLSVMVYWGFGYIFIGTMNESFTDALFDAIKPIFNGLDSYGFLAAVAFMTAAIWFIGVHGPSVTRPFLTPFMYTNLADNQAILAQGGHPHWALTYEFSYDFTASLGGTGATFVIPILFILFAKSKQLKAVGIASYIPIWFQVNEPALFGAPMILNPIYGIPFLILPIINILIYKMFIDVFMMNAAIADVPWSMPAVVGLLIGSAFDPLTVLLWVIMVTIDFFFYLPFVMIHDRMVCEQENVNAKEENLPEILHYSYFDLSLLWFKKKIGFKNETRTVSSERYALLIGEIHEERAEKKEERAIAKQQKIEEKQNKKVNKNNKDKTLDNNQENEKKLTENKDNYNVLVVCYGAGTSAMLAASAGKALSANGIKNISIDSAAYGAHTDKMKNADLVILSPQVKMYLEDFEQSAEPNTKIVTTTGKQYIDATNNKDKALELLKDNLSEAFK